MLDTISTLETVKALPSWSIFMPELLPLVEPLALWSEAGRFPPLELALPVPLAEGELLEADGLVLALPLAVVPVPGALSLMVPLPLPEVEAVVELLVLVPAGAVVVVVVVVVGAALPLVLAVVEPLMPELLLVLAELFDQSPCTFTE